MIPALVHAWLFARSRARGLPDPVADHGGLRVDTRTPAEYCRWVFAAPSAEIAALASAISQPGRLIKLCGTADQLQALLPGAWEAQPSGFFMRAGRWPAPPPLPHGYRGRVSSADKACHVVILDRDGAVAASGFAAETGEAFVYDRIVTAPAHRRRGLGSAVMAMLRACRTCHDIPELLVATDAGRRLYEPLGWQVLSPYATASLQGPSAGG